MARRNQRDTREREETFEAEMPSTVWPPTVTQHPVAFVASLRRLWGRGLALLIGALGVGVGFFVIHGPWGQAMGGLGAAVFAVALLWEFVRR